jgi:hypothetical protein
MGSTRYAVRQLVADFLQDFLELLGHVDFDEVERVFDALRQARDRDSWRILPDPEMSS